MWIASTDSVHPQPFWVGSLRTHDRRSATNLSAFETCNTTEWRMQSTVGRGSPAPPYAAHAGLRTCPATLLISSLRSASSVFPATQEMAFDSRHMLFPAGMFTVSAEL